MKGFGAVVTGTLIAGTVRKEEEVEIFPARKRARVRGVQVHGSTADQAIAGQRTALNLAGVQMEELARGMTLAPPGVFEPTQRFEVQISLLKDAKPLKNRARVHFHAFTSETIAEVALRGVTELKPGASAFAQLRTAEPLLLLPEIAPSCASSRRSSRLAAPWCLTHSRCRVRSRMPCNAFCKHFPPEIARKRCSPASPAADMKGLSLAAAVRETGLKQSVLQPMIAALVQQKQIIQVAEFLLPRTPCRRPATNSLPRWKLFTKPTRSWAASAKKSCAKS